MKRAASNGGLSGDQSAQRAQRKRAKLRHHLRRKLGGLTDQELYAHAESVPQIAQALRVIDTVTGDDETDKAAAGQQTLGSAMYAQKLTPATYRNLMRYADVWLRVIGVEIESEIRDFMQLILEGRVAPDRSLTYCSSTVREEKRKAYKKKFHSVHPDFHQDHLKRRKEFVVSYYPREQPRGLLPGDSVWVWRRGGIGKGEGKTQWATSGDERVRYQGEIQAIIMGNIEVGFNEEAYTEAEKRFLSTPHNDWQLDVGPSLVQHRRMREAVGYLTSSKVQPEMRDLLCRMVPPVQVAGFEVKDADRPEWDREFKFADIAIHPGTNDIAVSQAEIVKVEQHLSTRRINESQHQAISGAVRKRLTLIQGPPGTGKTSTSVELILLWVKVLKRPPVLSCAYSNIAVDNIMEGCLALGLNCVRYGAPERASPGLLKNMIETRVQESPEVIALSDQVQEKRRQGQYIGDLLSQLRKLKADVETQLVRSAEVVFATCIVAGRVCQDNFSLVLIDESTQATEPASLVPITKSLAQVVLVGDHKQLPPVLTTDRMQSTRLRTSLFERLLGLGAEPREALGTEQGIRAHMLQIQYRMHPILSAWPNYMFYQSKLADGVTAEDRPAPPGIPWPRSDHLGPIPLAFFAMTSTEVGVETSKSNYGEAQVLAVLLERILRCLARNEVGACRPDQIGIVAPYAAQVRLIENELISLLGPSTANLIEIKSVDGFQGRQKEIIFFSCTRSNPSGNVGFLADPRRLNVALTRARRGLVVLGDPNTLCHEGTWASWLTFVYKNNLVAPIELCGLTELRGKEQEYAVPGGFGWAEVAARNARPAEVSEIDRPLPPDVLSNVPANAPPEVPHPPSTALEQEVEMEDGTDVGFVSQSVEMAMALAVAAYTGAPMPCTPVNGLPAGFYAQCTACDMSFSGPIPFNAHLKSKKHVARAAAAKIGGVNVSPIVFGPAANQQKAKPQANTSIVTPMTPIVDSLNPLPVPTEMKVGLKPEFSCAVCGLFFSSTTQQNAHMGGKKHLKKLKAAMAMKLNENAAAKQQ